MTAHPPRRVLQFGLFTLDPSRSVLRRGNEELALRPKSFDVLRYLLERPGRIAAKGELFEAVWPGLSVTDDSLVQCVMDIRDALGDDGRTIIKTIPRRGYLIDAAVSTMDLTDEAGAASPRSPTLAGLQGDGSTPRPAPLPRDRRNTHNHPFAALRARIRTSPRQVAIIAGVLVLITGALAAIALRRPAPMNTNVVHQTMLATATFEKERSPKTYREAFALFAKAIDMDPDFVPALIGYAQVIIVGVTEHWAPPREQDMRLNLAEAAIERAISLEPGNPRALRVKGFLLRARGQPDRAIAALERARALSPKDPWVHADLGRARIDAGQAMDAIADLETAMRLSPDDPASYVWSYQAGIAAVHAGQPRIALDWLQKSEQANPAYLQHILLWRAVASADLGYEVEGHQAMARYIANAPSFTVAAWNQHFKRPNATVAVQRARIAAELHRLGLPDGKMTSTESMRGG